MAHLMMHRDVLKRYHKLPTKIQKKVAEFIDRFRKTFGSVECKEIHTKIWGKTYDLRKPEDYTYFMKRPQHDQ